MDIGLLLYSLRYTTSQSFFKYFKCLLLTIDHFILHKTLALRKRGVSGGKSWKKRLFLNDEKRGEENASFGANVLGFPDEMEEAINVKMLCIFFNILRPSLNFGVSLLIHKADPQPQPAVITIFTYVVHQFVCPNFAKQNKFKVNIVIFTGGPVDLAKWIIDD